MAPETIFYLSGYEGYTYWTIQALIFSASGDEAPTLILRDTDLALGHETTALGTIRTYQFLVDDPAQLVADAVVERGLSGGVIATEKQTGALTAGTAERFAERLGLELRDCSRLLSRLRVRKSSAELEYVRQAAKASQKGMSAAIEAVRPGMTEIDLAAIIESTLRNAGSDYSAMPTILGSGPRTLSPHATPTERVIGAGEPVLFYFAGVARRYHVTTYRTVHIGAAPAKFRDLYSAAQQALAILVDNVEVSRPVAEVAALAAGSLRQGGYDRYQVARWGYGVGISYPPVWLEAFDVMEESDDVFEAGTLMCLHACFVAPELDFGLMVGADYLLTDRGIESLDPIGPALIEIQ